MMPLPAPGFPSVLSSPRVRLFSSLYVWFSPSLCFFSLFFFCSALSPLNLFCYSSLFFSFLLLFSLSHVLLTLCLLSSHLISVFFFSLSRSPSVFFLLPPGSFLFFLFFFTLSSSVLPIFFLPLLSLTLPPLRFASLSPFIAKTACVFYNEDV